MPVHYNVMRCFGNNNPVSVSEGCGAFAEHHWHRPGEHCRLLLCNPDPQCRSQHSGATAARSSPPGGQSSEGCCFLQHVRQTESAKYKQPPITALISPLVYFNTRNTSCKYLLNCVLCSNFMLSFLHRTATVDKHVLFVVSDCKRKKLGDREILVKLIHFYLTRYLCLFFNCLFYYERTSDMKISINQGLKN